MGLRRLCRNPTCQRVYLSAGRPMRMNISSTGTALAPAAWGGCVAELDNELAAEENDQMADTMGRIALPIFERGLTS